MNESTVTVPAWAPPRRVNRLLTAALKTPGLQRIAGKGFILLTVTGRRTAKRYTAPVRYKRNGD